MSIIGVTLISIFRSNSYHNVGANQNVNNWGNTDIDIQILLIIMLGLIKMPQIGNTNIDI
jgi:hypothetical protein